MGEFGSDKTLHDFFANLLQTLTKMIFEKYTSIDMLEQAPDVVEEFFFLVDRALKYCPSTVFIPDSSMLVEIIRIGLQSLKIPHPDVQNATLEFFETLISMCNPSSKVRKRAQFLDENVVKVMTDLVPQFAPSLVQNLVENISGHLPRHALRVDDSKGSISNVLWCLVEFSKISPTPESIQVWIDTAFASMSAAVQVEAERLEINQGKLQGVSSLGERGKAEFHRLLNQLRKNIYRHCRTD